MEHDKARRRPLYLGFDLALLHEIGALIYQTAESALLELIARAYETGATTVDIQVTPHGTGRHAVVMESDVGMSDDQLESLGDVGHSLAVARNPQRMWSTSGRRRYGNLAHFVIGKRIEITTCRKGSGTASCVTIDLKELEKLEKHRRALCASRITESKCGKKESRTRIAITEIPPKKRLVPAALDRLAAHLAQRLMFADPKFAVRMSFGNISRRTVSNTSWRGVITRTTRWELPDEDLLQDPLCRHWKKVKGSVEVSGIALTHATSGIRLLVDNRDADVPGFFDAILPTPFTSRASGFLHVDFVAGHKGALKPGNPPTINWGHREMKRLRSDLSAAVLNIYFLWARQCEDSARSLLVEEIGSEWFQELPPAKRGELLESLLSVEHDEKGHIIDHTLRIIGRLMSPGPKRVERALHRDVTSNKKVMSLYKSQNYYQAASECVKVYCEKVREITLNPRLTGATDFHPCGWLRPDGRYPSRTLRPSSGDF